jgi:hypothetical protein
MSKKQRTIIKFVSPLLAGGLLVAVLLFRDTPVARAHIVPSPSCDFTTGGGFVITDNGNHANFGLVAGCKPDRFFGHVNFVDHDTTGYFAGLHVSSDQILAYYDSCITTCGLPPGQTYRDICGTADTNLFGTVKFRVRTLDKDPNTGGGRGVDRFGLKLTGVSPPWTGMSAVVVTTRALAGGDIELHKPAPPSTTGPATPDEVTACGSLDTGLGT